MNRFLASICTAAALLLFGVSSLHAEQTGNVVEQGRGGRYGNWLFTPGAPGTGAGVSAFNSRGLVTVSATTSTLVLATYTNRRGGQIQNQATTSVYCSDQNSVSSTPGNYAFVLKAATGAADGSGGSATITSPYTGPIYCISSASSSVSFSDF